MRRCCSSSATTTGFGGNNGFTDFKRIFGFRIADAADALRALLR